jgi:hypothetical protein
MLAFMLAVSPVWTGAAPPESTRIDPTAIYTMFLRDELETLRHLDEDIQSLKARIRRNPSTAAQREKLMLRLHNLRNRALCSCYTDVCGLLRQYKLQVRLAFTLFVLDWSSPHDE